MKRLLLIIPFLVSGCAGTQTIYVPKEVTCHVKDVEAPSFPTQGLRLQDSMFDKVRALIAENQARKAYEAKLVAVNKACQ